MASTCPSPPAECRGLCSLPANHRTAPCSPPSGPRPKPDRAPPNEVAHHDPIGVPLADRDLVDANGLGTRRTRFGELRAHVLLFQRLDSVPVEIEFLRDVLDRRLPTATAYVKGKAFGIERVVRQELQLLALHVTATPARHAPNLDLQVDARVATGKIANQPYAPIVPARVHATAAAADCFFERRTRMTTRAFGSPNTPRTVGCGRNPGKVYVSHSRRGRFAEFGIGSGWQIPTPCEMPESQYPQGFLPCSPHQITRTTSRRPKILKEV